MFHNTDNNPAIHQNNIQAGHEMKAYLEQFIPEQRAMIEKHPKMDDTLSRLLKSTFDDNIYFNESRIMTNIMGILVGGIETTSQAIVQILDQLFKRPKVFAEATQAAKDDNDQLLYKYCWEALCFNPINPFVIRACTENYRVASGTWRSTCIEKGRTVLVCTRSAMQDGRELNYADSFCIDRPNYHYVHLGYGSHTCLGDQVSRVQVPEIIKRLLKLPNLQPCADIDYKGGLFPESYTISFNSDSKNRTCPI